MISVSELANRLGIRPEECIPFGNWKAKISLDLLQRLRPRPGAKYIAISSINPTPLGEGKTVNTIGLALGLNRIGKKTICTLRQPSMGPIFGIKGGATGGGKSQILPVEEINLHLTGDFHAVAIAHNLLAAALDNSLYHGNPLRLPLEKIQWRRVVDVNDRALRSVRLGLGGNKNSIARDSGFDITAASELMSILCLATGLKDMREKLGKVMVGESEEGRPVTAEDLKCAGAMAALLRESIQPSLLQTSEGGGAFLHSGPFANIGPGNSSVIADQMALRLADYVVTESGFGADMGLEKLFNIKCRVGGLRPDAVALVITVRALKMHSGRFQVVAGKPLDPALFQEDLESLSLGIGNMQRQIGIVKKHGVPVVVAVNRFGNESEKEIRFVLEKGLEAGAESAVISEVFEKGGEGGTALAQAIVTAADRPNSFQPLYPLRLSIREKIETIATQIYGAASVSYAPGVESKIERIENNGLGLLPICMAKTQFSLSHDPKLRGAPSGFVFPIADIRVMAGAGFITPLAGEIMTMPGFGSHPAYQDIDLDDSGHVVGMH